MSAFTEPLCPTRTVLQAGEVSTGIRLDDCRLNEWQLSHVHGSSICVLWPRDTRTRDLVFTRGIARQLASYLNHFSQHAQLPQSWPQIEYHI